MITFEVPDELVAQLRIDPTSLPALLQEALRARSTKETLPATSTLSGPPLYQEIMDFLTSSPTPEQLVAFKISEATQERLEDVLYKHREEALTPDELAELETYRQLNHLIIRLKARALHGQPLLSQHL
jgi:hypothetical protein